MLPMQITELRPGSLPPSGFYSNGPETHTRFVFGRGGSKTILYIEDDPADAELLRRSLTEAGGDVQLVVFTDAAEALLLCATTSELPDIVVIDINLPKIGGLQLLTLIKAMPKFSKTKLVLLTTSSSEFYRKQADQIGADGYFRKPFGYDGYDKIASSLRAMAGLEPAQ